MKIPIYELNSIPNISGVYFLFAGDKLIYIGATRWLSQRLNTDRIIRDFLKFGVTSVQYAYIHEDQVFGIEYWLINMFNPVANKLRKG